MDPLTALIWAAVFVAAAVIAPLRARLLLSRAKPRALQCHARIARRLARLVPYYEFDDERFFDSDGAPAPVAARRRAGFEHLAGQLGGRSPETIRRTEALASGLSDLQFTAAYRVPFPYRAFVSRHLKTGALLEASSRVEVVDVDGRTAYDLT